MFIKPLTTSHEEVNTRSASVFYDVPSEVRGTFFTINSQASAQRAAHSARWMFAAILMFLIPGRCLALGQLSGLRTIQAAGFTSLAAIEAACAEAGPKDCNVQVTTHQKIEIAGDHTTPSGLHFQFGPRGLWEVRGGALTFGDGMIEAADRQRIFTDGSEIRGLDRARPEWFGETSPEGYGAVALAGAYSSTKPWGTILLRNATYISPFFDPKSVGSCDGSTVLYLSPRIFLGAGRPTVDDSFNPQKLQGGTVIRGEICGGVALGAYHLGLDEGPYVVSRLFGGHPSYGIMLARTQKLHQVRGTVLEDVAVLTNGMEDQHSVLIEGQDEVSVQGLWVWTVGGTHGLVLKSSRSSVRDFHCRGASSDCLIIKSDAATDGAGLANSVAVDGVDIHWLRQPGDTGGIVLDSRWDVVRDVTLDHVTQIGTTTGIVGMGSIFHTLQDVRVRNWAAEVSGFCLNLDFSTEITVENFSCRMGGTSGLRWAMRVDGRHISLRDGLIGCVPAQGCGGVLDGIVDMGRSTLLERIAGEALTGYLVRQGTGGGETTRDLTEHAMGRRLISRYTAPDESVQAWCQRWIGILKPNVRMVWTAQARRWSLLPRWVRMGLLFGGCAVLLMLACFRRRRTR